MTRDAQESDERARAARHLAAYIQRPDNVHLVRAMTGLTVEPHLPQHLHDLLGKLSRCEGIADKP